jgi:hypothetical protein
MEMEKYKVQVFFSGIIGNKTIKPRQQQKKICDVEGEGAVNDHAMQWWFTLFTSGNLCLEDEQHPGQHRFGIVRRPKTLLNNSHEQVRADYHTHLALQRVLIHRHLTALGKIYKSCRIVPHELNCGKSTTMS